MVIGLIHSALSAFGFAFEAAVVSDVVGAFANTAEHVRRLALVVGVASDAASEWRTSIVTPTSLSE